MECGMRGVNVRYGVTEGCCMCGVWFGWSEVCAVRVVCGVVACAACGLDGVWYVRRVWIGWGVVYGGMCGMDGVWYLRRVV
ncbi:hypothetical protein RB195_008168 [Necator americanus]|uniref:Transmembrane protein n=1 Tax=Necator americanus TaxID=51031 RepID=A0ABR1CMB1_NECAM